MRATDFIDLAERLFSNTAAAEQRSATSRAYYGAFHRAIEHIAGCGVTVPAGPECHKKVRWILDNSGDSEVKKVSTELNSLRLARNKADYELANADPEKLAVVELNVKKAKAIISTINARFSSGANAAISQALRNYAKTLGLSVT